MCPFLCLGNSTMSLIDVSIINDTACITHSLYSKAAAAVIDVIIQIVLQLQISGYARDRSCGSGRAKNAKTGLKCKILQNEIMSFIWT